MQREALIGLTVILTLIAMGASPGGDPIAQQLPELDSEITLEQVSASDSEANDGAAHLEIFGTNDDERITLTMQLDVTI